MNITCTGLVSTIGTALVSGIGTLCELELRAGDIIKIQDTECRILGIFSNTKFVVDRTIAIFDAVPLILVKANPDYLLPIPAPNYFTFDTSFGSVPNRSSSKAVLSGGQVFASFIDRSMSTLNTNKAMELPDGFEYYSLYDSLSVVTTEANSTVLTLAESDVKVTTSAGSNKLHFTSGQTMFVMVGMKIQLEGVSYTIIGHTRSEHSTDTVDNRDIILDKTVPKTMYNIFMKLDPDLSGLFPSGSQVLLNGKLYTIGRASGKTLQVRYPISETATITIRKPLLASQYSVNTTEFSNIAYPPSLIVPGNLLITQNINSEDNLFEVNTCYTEAKYIGRVFDDGRVVTNEKNGMTFTGIVIIGVPNKGLLKSDQVELCNAANVYHYSYSFSWYAVGDYIWIKDAAYKILSIGSYMTVDRTITATGFNYIYRVNKPYIWPDYTDLVSNLVLRLAEWIIKNGVKRTSSINSLTKEFLKEWSFAYMATAQQHTIYSVYNPDYFAVNLYSSPRIPYSEEFALCATTPNGLLEIDNIVYRQCGLPLSEVD